MKKYLAKLLFNININEGTDATQFDEQIRIIESTSVEDAFYKARKLGKAEEETFVNTRQELVSWQFIDVAEIYALETLKDGAQVYSNTHNISDKNSFIHYIRQKSMEIQAKNLTFT